MPRDDWPVNEKPCDHEGCEDTDTTPCVYIVYKYNVSVLNILFHHGLKTAWRFWRDGYVEVLDGYYCAEHAYLEGFCWTCGNFYAGASEHFDFQINGQWLCDACWENFKSEFGEDDEDDYYPGPWDD